MPTLAACDPALLITIRNRTNEPARLAMTTAWAGRPDTTVVRILAPKGHGRRSQVRMYYGIGGWSDTAMARTAQHIKGLKMTGKTDSLIFATPTEVKNLFSRSRKRGFMRSEMVIDIH